VISIPLSNIIGKQIYFLRLLSTVSRDEIKVMLKPQSPWCDFFDVLTQPPDRPIHSRSILKNELVLEIDSDNWAEVRDGTRRIVRVLESWRAGGSYYLSYSGNRSIHVHVFTDLKSIHINEDIVPLLEGHSDVISTFKAYMTRQIAIATGTAPDMQLTGTHLIRMEGGFNEKSHKYCTQIHEVPDEKPQYYDIEVPGSLPPERWNLSGFQREINAFLKVHYTAKPSPIRMGSGRPIDPEPLKEILKPVFIEGYRHYIVLALAGWLKRHSVPEEKTLEIVRSLNPNDKTPAKTAATVRETYRNSGRTIGLPSLIGIIANIASEGKISRETAKGVIEALEAKGVGFSADVELEQKLPCPRHSGP
jgi:hypothetical protein